MDIKVTTKYLRLSPRKMRPILFGLRGKKATDAQNLMKFTNKKGAAMIYAVLNSGVAIAKENDLDLETVFVKQIACNEGPTLKRSNFGARGRMFRLEKRSCHINLVLESVEAPENIKTEKSTRNKKQ